MKIKTFIASLLLVSSMSTFAVDLTSSPLFTAVDLVRSAVGTVVAPFVVSGAASVASSQTNKEQLAAVRSDAVDFLAGNDATDVLKASIKEIRERSSELKQLSDSQIAGLIVTALE